jgi:hypothetical protein
LIIDLEQICEANLISAVPIKSFSEGQLDLEFAVVTPIRRHGRVIATTKAA